MQDRFGFEDKNLPLASPLDYRGLDRAEGGTRNRFHDFALQLRAAAGELAFGKVYFNVPVAEGGVRANDDGMRKTMNTQTGFYGVVRANLIPSGIQVNSLTRLSQAGANAQGWGGDAPVDTQPAVSKPAPWLTRASRGNSFGIFRSGVTNNPHGKPWQTGNAYQAAAARRSS
jgi:hypothetical protein